MAPKRPIFLFAFANDAEGSLRLGEEQNACWNELAALDQEGIIGCQRLGFATLEQVYREFNRFNNQVYLFHYGGHTNSELIQLHGAPGSAVHLGAKIGQQEELKLAFLNGCKNYNQVSALLENGVPAVIATTAKIEDKRAIALAQQFYQALAGGNSIRKAFESAKGYIFDKYPELKATYRDAGFEEEDDKGFSWGLYAKEDAFLDWHIGLFGQGSRMKTLNRLRETSRKRYQAFTDTGGRFHYLSIDEALLAGIENTREDKARKFIETRIGAGKTPLENSLEVLWLSEYPHALLAGASGMGKTVSLIQLWEHYLDNEQIGWPAPVFIPLNEFNNRPEKGFIQCYIKEHYGGEDIDRLLREPLQVGETYYPHLILLLDGFNEVIADSNELILEINELRARDKYPGVQLVLSSRVDMRQTYQWQRFHLLELEPLSDEQIESYLKQPLPTNARLLELLRNPMMLSIYAAQTELPQRYREKGLLKEMVTSTGEMLFNVEMLQRIKIEELHVANLPEQAFRRFVLEHLLPAIGWQMQYAGLFFLEKKSNQEEQLDMEKALKRAIENCLNDKFFDAFPFFSEHLEEERFEGKPRKLFNQVVNQVCCRELALLVAEDGNYRFLHQGFRDFFAASHIQRSMEMAIVHNQGRAPRKRIFPAPLQKAPMDFYVRQLLGELESEHTNKMEWNEEEKRWQWNQGQFFLENTLSRLLEQCRGVFDENQLGYTLWNLLIIWKEQRGELSGIDLRRLNYGKFSFNNLRASRPGLAALLSEGLLTKENLFFQGHSNRVSSLAYSPDGNRLLTGSIGSTAKVWDAQSGQCLLTLQGHSEGVNSVAHSPDGRWLLTGSIDCTAKVWDAQSGKCLLSLQGHSSEVNSVAYSPDGRRLLTGSGDNTAKVWDAKSGKCLLTLQGHSDWVNSVTYSPDGRRLLTGSDDHTAKIWDAQSGKCLLTLQGHSPEVSSVAYSPDGHRLLTGSYNDTAKIWDAQSGKCLLTLRGHSSEVNSVAFSLDGRRLLTGSDDNTAKVWDAQSGKCLLTLQGHSSEVISVTFSPDGRRLTCLYNDNTVKVWDAQSEKCLLTLQGHSSEVISVAFSPDGRRFTCLYNDNTVKVWDAQSEKCLLTLQDQQTEVISVAYSPDGHRLLTGSKDNTTKVWDAQSGQYLLTRQGLSARVSNVAFSSDGRKLFTDSDDNTAKVWDAQSRQCLLTLQGHLSKVSSVAFSPDERRLLTGSYDNTAKVWDALTGKCLMTLPNIPGLFIQGCDFRDLHPDSKLSEEEVALLRQYGGIFDEEDARRWDELMEKHFDIKRQ